MTDNIEKLEIIKRQQSRLDDKTARQLLIENKILVGPEETKTPLEIATHLGLMPLKVVVELEDNLINPQIDHD